jgi:hypothetical protein
VGLKNLIMDKKIIHGKLMNQHRLISNEIADIKASSYELSPQQKERVSGLERQLMMIMNQLHQLYNQ